ncbi:TonB-dependent siderophore receptor [Bergeriella denitrificans]|uniref:TonB-dependent siderophore receptor n=1 Tax=Bergeriella denitrificans TaxID=494 RepID=A0A378UH48_BERDE|nr:TonB-dependent siderophore receptor [Bergeriella denitrificans]STZ76694.1 TonB-dependent siderophore receptor [Bergeriella denitrificans]
MNTLFTRSLMAAAVLGAYTHAVADDAVDSVELETVNVVGSAGKIDGLKFKSAQSNAVIRAQEIAEKAPMKVEDTLAYESGVRVGQFGYDTKQEWIKVRGFDASVAVDGSPVMQNGFFTAMPNTYGLEAVELVKGADSLTYGSAETGGLINLVSKRPTRTAQGEIGVRAGTQGRLGVFGDYSGKLTADNSVRYRLVGDIERRKGDFNGKTDNYYIAPSLTWDISDKTELTVLASASRQKGKPTSVHLPATGVLFPSTIGNVAYGTTYQDGDDYVKRNTYSAGYEFKHDFGNDLKFSQNYRYSHQNLDWLGTFSYGTDWQDNTQAARGYSYTDGTVNSHTIDNRLSKTWQGNGWRNTLLGGVDYLHANTGGLNNGFGSVASTGLLNPFNGASGVVKTGSRYEVKQKQLGFYLRDQFTYGGLVANLGIRHDKAEADSLSSGTAGNYDVNHTSYQGSLMYNFKSGVSPYISYTESFKPTVGTDGYGNIYKPYEGRQYEAGVKYLPSAIDGKFSAAYFDLEEKNALAADPSNVQTQIGKRRGKGFELQAEAQLTDNLSASAAYTYTRSKQDTRFDTAIRTPLIPKHQASAQIKYAFDQGTLNGLTLGAGIRYVGSTADEQYWPGYKVPSYTLVDALAQYRFGKNWLAQLNANNLTGKKYVAGCDFYCYWGSERSVVGSVSYKF